MVDVVREIEKVVRVDVVLVDERPERRSVAVIEIFLQRPGGETVEAEEFRDVEGDPLVDLRPDPRIVRIEGVVEIEDPGVHVAEAARFGRGYVRRGRR